MRKPLALLVFFIFTLSVFAATDADLEPALRRLLADPSARLDLGRRAREVVDTGRGAVDRTLDQLEPLL